MLGSILTWRGVVTLYALYKTTGRHHLETRAQSVTTCVSLCIFARAHVVVYMQWLRLGVELGVGYRR